MLVKSVRIYDWHACVKQRLHVSFKTRSRNGTANVAVTVVCRRLELACTCLHRESTQLRLPTDVMNANTNNFRSSIPPYVVLNHLISLQAMDMLPSHPYMRQTLHGSSHRAIKRRQLVNYQSPLICEFEFE